MTNLPDSHKFVISKKSTLSRIYIIVLPKMTSDHCSKFGSFTCCFPTKEGIPCDHMVAIVKQEAVPNITRVELMPFWYTRAQWQLQYPKDMVYKSDIHQKRHHAPYHNSMYCITLPFRLMVLFYFFYPKINMLL